MSIGITELLLEINVQVIRALTGRLFTKEQIDAITNRLLKNSALDAV